MYVTSVFGSVDLKTGISRHAGASCFSPCYLLLQWQVLSTSLPIGTRPSQLLLSGEDEGEFLTCPLGGLPLGQEMGTDRGAATSCLFGLAQTCHGSRGTPYQLQCRVQLIGDQIVHRAVLVLCPGPLPVSF